MLRWSIGAKLIIGQVLQKSGVVITRTDFGKDLDWYFIRRVAGYFLPNFTSFVIIFYHVIDISISSKR
jgi:hypothetical protein